MHTENTTTQRLLTALAFLLLFPAFATAAQRLEIADWKFTRVWKTAAGEYHTYKGKLKLKNVSADKLQGVKVAFLLRDYDGKEIRKAEANFGSITAGNTLERQFTIPKAVQFGELRLVASYKYGGSKDGTDEFTTASAELFPEYLYEDELQMRILALSIDEKVPTKRKRRRNKVYMACRIMNLAKVESEAAVVKITFKGVSGKRRSKRSSRSGEEVVTLELSKKGFKPREEKFFKKVYLKGAPSEYESYSVEVTSKWKEDETAAAVTEDNASATGGQPEFMLLPGTVFKVGGLQFKDATWGRSDIILPLINTGNDTIHARRLTVTIVFLDKSGKTLKKVAHTYPRSVSAGKRVDIDIKGQKIPDFDSYEIEVDFTTD